MQLLLQQHERSPSVVVLLYPVVPETVWWFYCTYTVMVLLYPVISATACFGAWSCMRFRSGTKMVQLSQVMSTSVVLLLYSVVPATVFWCTVML